MKSRIVKGMFPPCLGRRRLQCMPTATIIANTLSTNQRPSDDIRMRYLKSFLNLLAGRMVQRRKERSCIPSYFCARLACFDICGGEGVTL